MAEGEIAASTISGSLGNVFGSIASGTIWTVIILISLGLVIGLFFFMRYRKKFDIKVEVLSQRADGTFSIYYDSGAILKDYKTGDRFIRLYSTKVELPVPPFTVMEKTNDGDLIRIWRKSETEFVYITKPHINKQTIIKQDGRFFTVAEQEYYQVEGDIAYWNTKRKQAHKDILAKNSLLSKIMEWMPQIIGGLFVVIILYILLNSLPELLSKLSELADKLNVINTAPGGAVTNAPTQ